VSCFILLYLILISMPFPMKDADLKETTRVV
jgi:hypothetical protein